MSQGSPAESRLRHLSRIVALLTATVGAFVLLGWAFDIRALKSILPGWATMKANTAIAFGLSAASLWLIGAGPQQLDLDWHRRALARLCAAAVLLLSAVTLAEYLFGWQSGIDQWLVQDFGGGLYPGRMAPATAASFLALGAALLWADSEWPRSFQPAQWLTLAVAFNGFVATLGYLYGVQSLYGVKPYSSMALHTALLFLLLGVAVACARPSRGIVARVIADDAGGFLIRRLLPAAILVPLAVGTLRLQGQLAGLYTSEFGVAMYTALNIAIFSALVLWTAAAVGRADADRKRVQRKLQEQFGRLDLLQQITHAIGERQDLQSIFHVTLRRVETDLPVDFACICLYDAAEQALTVNTLGAASQSLAHEMALSEEAPLAIDDNGLASCIKGQLVYEPDIGESRFPFPQRLARAGLRSLVFAPLQGDSGVFGVLVTARRQPHAFSSNACEFLRQLSEHVGLAAHQARLYQSLQQAYDDLRQSQQAILQQERLTALGQMASGIAHDINNAVSPVALYTESLLEREPNLSERARNYLTTIQRAVEDVAQTVGRMREFYRPRETQTALAPVDATSLVRQVIDLTRARWSDMAQRRGIDIQMHDELAHDLPALQGAESEIRDALTNLIFNAVDSMPNGGTLSLRTSVVRTPDAAVQIEVRDTGCGMDEETRRRCLEPFFTTKGERGTGMGLAMVFGMAQRHDAQLEIESEIGQGTVMRLIFPVASETADATSAGCEASLLPARGLRILVIDDDPLLIHSLRNILESDGHIVTAAEGGQAGIDAFLAARQRGESFTVVMTDLGMPFMDGRKVAAAIKSAAPDTPVVLLTGWGQRLMTDNHPPPHVDRVVGKPPRLQQLRAALADVTASIDP